MKLEPFEQYYIVKTWMDGPFDEGSLQVLLKHGINARTRTLKGQTALHCAVEKGHVELVDYLKKFGIDVNARDDHGFTILHTLLDTRYADKMNSTFARSYELRRRLVNRRVCEDLRFLIEHNPELNLNLQDYDARTPLHVAVKRRYGGFVEMLLSHGANPNIRDESGLTPLMSCDYFTVDMSCIRILLDHGANMYTSVTNGNTIFHVADGMLQQMLVDYVVEHDMLMNIVDSNGNTALHFICATCKLSVIESLPFDKLDLTILNKRGETPLQTASKAGQMRAVSLLIDKDGNKLVDGRTKDGLTPLHIAAVRAVDEAEFSTAVAAHLRQGGSIDARDKMGKTPLHYAIEGRSTFKTRVLIQNGADGNAKDNYGKNALYRAVQTNKCSIVDLILSSKGVDPRGHLHDGKTALHLASSLGFARIVKLMAKYNVDYDLLDANGNSPLFCAMFEMDCDIEPDFDRIQRLLDHGASLDPIYWIAPTISSHIGACPIDEYGEYFYSGCRSLTVKTLQLDLPQEEKFLQSFKRECRLNCDNKWDKLKKQCNEEIYKLQTTIIYGDMTFFEFFYCDDPTIAKAVCDKAFDRKRLLAEFPLYGNLIKGKLNMDIYRNDILLPKASVQLSTYLAKSAPLRKLHVPLEIARRILTHLSKDELFKFVESKYVPPTLPTFSIEYD